jgi:hypothetical protein
VFFLSTILACFVSTILTCFVYRLYWRALCIDYTDVNFASTIILSMLTHAHVGRWRNATRRD